MKVIGVVLLYHNPAERAVVLCIDDERQVQALDGRNRCCLACPNGSHDYVRHGITGLFAAFNIADGTVIGELHRQHRTPSSRSS